MPDSLLDWRPVMLVVICFVLLLLLSQVPFSYTFISGKERGYQSDLPFLQGFHAAEASDDMGRWRWSYSEAAIVVPGIGHRSVLVDFRIVSHRAQRQPQAAPTRLYVRMGDSMAIPLTLRLEGATYQLYVPAQALEQGVLRLHLSTTRWQNEADRRDDLGVAIGEQINIRSIHTTGWVLPELWLWLAWSLSLAILWPALRVLTFSPQTTFWLLLPFAVAIPALLLWESPRLGFGNVWILQWSLLTLATAVLCVWLVPPLLMVLDAQPPQSILRWLLLLLVLSFILKYGGRLYPESMPGDLQLHVNRYLKTITGEVYIPAQHRGLPFPFPNGLYILLAPLTLTGWGIHSLFEFTGGLFEATTVILLYLLLTHVTANPRMGLLAAATYALTSGGFMNAWFAFETQIAGQWVTILLLLLIVMCWPRYNNWLLWGWMVMLFIQVFLGHIGQFINSAMVGVLAIPLLWWRANSPAERRASLWLLAAGLTAGVFVFLFYYSAFLGLIIEQIVGVTTGGLNEVTGRPPIPRATTLQVLWEGGFITHFGFFPVLLAFLGAALPASQRLRHSPLRTLLWLTFLVSASQAVLPLITLNSITTRWLMFSSWAIAVSCALALLPLWRRGPSAKVVTLAMTGYVCWLTISLWFEAMALRLPPIEPF